MLLHYYLLGCLFTLCSDGWWNCSASVEWRMPTSGSPGGIWLSTRWSIGQGWRWLSLISSPARLGYVAGCGLWLSCRGGRGDQWLQGVVLGEDSHTHNLHHLIMSPHCVWRKAGGGQLESCCKDILKIKALNLHCCVVGSLSWHSHRLNVKMVNDE